MSLFVVHGLPHLALVLAGSPVTNLVAICGTWTASLGSAVPVLAGSPATNLVSTASLGTAVLIPAGFLVTNLVEAWQARKFTEG